jgi:hypothetical protein
LVITLTLQSGNAEKRRDNWLGYILQLLCTYRMDMSACVEVSHAWFFSPKLKHLAAKISSVQQGAPRL